jgi:phosphoglycolate phosphatase
MHYRNVLFDLDGTLTDPREGITRSIQYALSKMGIDEPDLRKLEHFIGPPLFEAFMQHYSFDTTAAQQALDHYRERFKLTGLYENFPYEGILALLEMLRGQGRRLYIATSKPHVFAVEIAKHFGMAHHFTQIYGSELDGTRSNKAELIAHLIAQEALEPAQTVMIGDRKHDLIGARRNNLDCIAVGYGFGSHEELSGEKPTYHFETLVALHDAFRR